MDINYFKYDRNFYIYFELIEDKFYNNMFIICSLLENLIKTHNTMGSFLVLSSVPVNTWYDETFLHIVVCSDIHALKYIPEELKTSEVIMNSLYLVPKQEDFNEHRYFNRYSYVIEYTPKVLWEDLDFVEKIKNEFTKIKEYVNVKNDIDKLLNLIDTKVNKNKRGKIIWKIKI